MDFYDKCVDRFDDRFYNKLVNRFQHCRTWSSMINLWIDSCQQGKDLVIT